MWLNHWNYGRKRICQKQNRTICDVNILSWEVDYMSEFVEEFKIGNTNVKIADDYCRDKTPEDVNAILKRIGVNALPHFAMNKQDKAG